MSDKEFESVTSGFPDWNIRTKEEAYYFLIFRKFKYDKGRFAQARPRVNRIRSLNEDALQALKSRRFNRYKPYRIEEADTHRLKFVMLWGALGKAMADGRDIEAVDFLKAFLSGVETAASIKSGITVLLADSHAKMNAINPLAAYTYLQNVKELLERNGFKTVYLSCLWKKWELEPEEIRQRAAAVKPANSALSEQLKRSSRRHYNGNPEEGGMIYYAMRLLEKQHLEREFEGSIFLTYNAPLLREILPDMPTLHLRSKKGSSEPPWLPAR